jgi:hypothetical protein
VKSDCAKIAFQQAIVIDVVHSERRDVYRVGGGRPVSARNHHRRDGLTGANFHRDEGLVLASEDCVLEMTAENIYGVTRSFHFVEFENSQSMANRNAREDDLGSNLQLPRDVLVVLHGSVLSAVSQSRTGVRAHVPHRI